MLQNIETNGGGPFGAIQNFSKQVIAQEKVSETHQDSQRGILSIFWSERRCFCFGRDSEVSSVMNLRS